MGPYSLPRPLLCYKSWSLPVLFGLERSVVKGPFSVQRFRLLQYSSWLWWPSDTTDLILATLFSQAHSHTRSLHSLFLLPEMFFAQGPSNSSLTTTMALSKCHLVRTERPPLTSPKATASLPGPKSHSSMSLTQCLPPAPLHFITTDTVRIYSLSHSTKA